MAGGPRGVRTVAKRAEIAGVIVRTERQLGHFLADLVILTPGFACLPRNWSRRRSRAKRIGKLIYGLSKENCRAAASTRLRQTGEPSVSHHRICRNI